MGNSRRPQYTDHIADLRRYSSGSVGIFTFLSLLALTMLLRANILFAAAVVTLPLNLVAWILAHRRARAISDTPTSKVASAAQGYCEIIGAGKQMGEDPLFSLHSQTRCLWYRYLVEECSPSNEWNEKASGESKDPFALDDGSGVCAINPDGAEILVRGKKSWEVGDQRYTEWILFEQQPLYVVGQFTTSRPSEFKIASEQCEGRLLSKPDGDVVAQNGRLERERDRRCDPKEQEAVRAQARSDAQANPHSLEASGETHIMQRPSDGRVFLISDHDPAALSRRYRLWSRVHLAIAVVALISLPFLWRIGH
jgi:hypothetical protein